MRLPTGARAGFTLVEVVLAMFILLIGMTSILGLLSFGAALSRTASLRSGASSSIEAVMADLEERLFPLVVDEEGLDVTGEPVPITGQPVPGHAGLSYSAQAAPNPENPLEYRVDVEIFWSTGGAKRSRKFQTLLLREVPFGERLRQRFVQGVEPPKLGAAPAAPSSPQKP